MRKVLLFTQLLAYTFYSHSQNINTNALNFGWLPQDDVRGEWVNIPNSPISGSFTIEFWVKGAMASGSYNGHWWTGLGIIDADIYGGFFATPDNDFGISLSDYGKIAFGVGALGGNDVTIKTTSDVNDQQWHHIAATWDQSSKAMKLYLDGTLNASGTSSNSSNRTPTSIVMGKLAWSANNWGGTLDEVRIWNVARTGSQIASNKDKQINGAMPGLVASYHFNQGVASGNNTGVTTLLDDSGNNRNGTLYNFNLSTDFSNWVSAGFTLPVIWQSFTAKKKSTGVELNWSTGSEQNTKDFEVQFSKNTQDWSALGSVAAAGNSSTARQYSFMHNNPLKGNAYNYYRILQRDLDGKFSYSKIVSIVFNEPGPEVQIYPNPALDNVTIYVAEKQEIRISNMAGATIWQGVMNAGRHQLPVSHLPKGSYMITYKTGSQIILIQ